MREHKSFQETYSFDAELTDSNGRRLTIDCEVKLPTIWGDGADIRLAIPHSAMPFGSFENPCELTAKFADTEFCLHMKEVWYRKLTSSVYPSRNLGASPIFLTHISGIQITEKCALPESKFIIYISSPDFLSESAVLGSDERMIDDLASFECPKLGVICLQRYWVKSRLESSDGFSLRFGYLLKISAGKSEAEPDEMLRVISPVLDLMSVFFRQRTMVLGWEYIGSRKRERFWKYPLEPPQSKYVSVEPKRYLVTLGNLAYKLEAALSSYYDLNKLLQKSIFKLSYSLCPAINLRDSERFMALFRDLESIAAKSVPQRSFTDDDRTVIDNLRNLAEPFRESNPAVFDRLTGLANKVEKGDRPVTQSISTLFQINDVRCSDLWKFSGDKGLVDIRNKLAHRGAHRIHHQALAVATFHLSLLVERLVHCLLGLELSEDDFHAGRDEWLQRDYVKRLKDGVFNAAIRG
jgi:hypothetical protein